MTPMTRVAMKAFSPFGLRDNIRIFTSLYLCPLKKEPLWRFLIAVEFSSGSDHIERSQICAREYEALFHRYRWLSVDGDSGAPRFM